MNYMVQNTGWNYSDLVKSAQTFGGPEKFVKTIHAAGYSQGFKEGIKVGYECFKKNCLFGTLVLTGVVVGTGVFLIRDNFKKQKQIEQLENEKKINASDQFLEQLKENEI